MPTGVGYNVTASGDNLDLNLFNANIWTGSVNSTWDINGTANWANGVYHDGDAVQFDDTALGSPGGGNVVVSGTVNPLQIRFANDASLTYTLSGNGSIAGPTAVIVSGGGQVNMNMANNTYTGGTALGNGLLQIGADSTVTGGSLVSGPLGTGILVLSGGTLQSDNGSRTVVNPVLVTGPVTLAGLTFDPQGTGSTFTVSNSPALTIAAPVTINNQILGDTLVMAGPSVLTVTSPANSYTAAQVSGGTLVGSVAAIPGPVALSNGANVTYNQATDGTLNQLVSGNGTLGKTGAATLTIGVQQSYNGPTVISNGTLKLGARRRTSPRWSST